MSQQTLAQDGHGGRKDEDRHGVIKFFLDLQRALYVDFEKHVDALIDFVSQRLSRRAV